MKPRSFNITPEELFGAYAGYARYLMQALLRYRTTYRNYPNVLLHIFMKRYPTLGRLRNGDNVILSDRMTTYFLTLLEGKTLEYDLEDNTITLSIPNYSDSDSVKVRFEGAIRNGDILATFLEREYKKMPVSGKVIVDIGANIGDTAIYFALNGAHKVLAIEPFVESFNFAVRNVKNNGLSHKIDLLLAGCSGTSGELFIDPLFRSNIASSLKPRTEGIKIPILSLEDIIIKTSDDNSDLVLKMDCEGCEYDSIISSPNEVLKKFRYIQIEYHHGYLDLKSKLEQCNFKVTQSRPMANYRRQYIGYLYAEQS